jgi:hypothetical protein
LDEEHSREERLEIQQKPKQQGVLDNKIVVAAILIIGFCWLLTYSNISTLLFKVPLAELPTFQADMMRISIILTIIFVTAMIFVFYLKDKLFEIRNKENNAIIQVDSHTQFPTIETIAKVEHGLILGRNVYTSPLMPYTEAGSVPTSRFFEFENLSNGQVIGHSLWRQDYVRKITTHLMYRDYFGRVKYDKFRHGESRQERFRSIADTTASKKLKELRQIGVSEEEGSMTEE